MLVNGTLLKPELGRTQYWQSSHLKKNRRHKQNMETNNVHYIANKQACKRADHRHLGPRLALISSQWAVLQTITMPPETNKESRKIRNYHIVNCMKWLSKGILQ